MNQSSVIKLKIKEEVLNAVLGKEYILSTSIVGSFITSNDLSGISDIDVIIIVDKLNEFNFNQTINSFQNIESTSLGLKGHEVIVNNTFGPLKFNLEKNIVFHVMIYDVKGHKKHVEESPFTCYSWEKFPPLMGYSLKEVHPVLNIQLTDILNSRRGLFSYLDDIEKGVITYRKYEFTSLDYKIVKDKFELDEKHRLEYSYHITFHLLNNLHEIISKDNSYLSPYELIKFYKDLNFISEADSLFFLELFKWKKEKGIKPQNIICRVKAFISNFFNSVDALNKSSIATSFFRHDKTSLNDGTFLGVRRDPSIIKGSKISNKNIYEIGYHSQLKRSKETLDYFNCKNHVESALINEIDYGLAEGLTINQLSKIFPKIIKSWAKGEDPRFPEGENQSDVLKRVEKFFKQFEFNKKTIVVTHLVTLRMILTKHLDIKLKDLYKIKVDHLENFDVLMFKEFRFLNFTKELRNKLRNQLSIFND